MFIGTVHKKMATMIAEAVPFKEWGQVFVGCSGSFRGEQIVNFASPETPVYGNDVSFLSCAIGYGLTNQKFPYKFEGELDFLSKFNGDDPKLALACTGVALLFSKYPEKYEYGRQMRKEILTHLDELVAQNVLKNEKMFLGTKLAGFYAGDFKQQIERAKEEKGGFVSFAPTYKGGYEKQYKLINENVKWNEPSYEIWDPKDTHTLIEKCLDYQIPFCIYADNRLKDSPIEPSLLLKEGGHPVYAYTGGASKLRIKHTKYSPFKYKPLDVSLINERSKLTVCKVTNEHIAFLKTIYLAKGIDFKSGQASFLVFIDGMLAGGITYAQGVYVDPLHELYILSDFSVSQKTRVSKLIALVATSRTLIDLINRSWMVDIKKVVTTAFTNKPVSMKYRGIFTIKNRKEGAINYQSDVRELNPQEIFDFWYKKYGTKA